MNSSNNRSAALKMYQSIPPMVAAMTDGFAQASKAQFAASDLLTHGKQGIPTMDRIYEVADGQQPAPQPSPLPWQAPEGFATSPSQYQEPWEEWNQLPVDRHKSAENDEGQREPGSSSEFVGPSQWGPSGIASGSNQIPKDDYAAIQKQLDELRRERAGLTLKSQDMNRLIQARRNMDVPMPKMPDIAKTRLTDTERIATILAGFLGGGATGVMQASNAARAGSGQRAQRENVDRERLFAQETALARQKVEAAKNNFEVEKLLLSDADRKERDSMAGKLAELNQRELGHNSKLKKIREDGLVQVGELGLLKDKMASDYHGWTDNDLKELERRIAEIALGSGIDPSVIRNSLGEIPKVRYKKDLDEFRQAVNDELSLFVRGINVAVNPAVMLGRFAKSEDAYVRGKITASRVSEEVIDWLSKIKGIETLISRGDENSLNEALGKLRIEKHLGEIYAQRYSGNADIVKGELETRKVLNHLVTLAQARLKLRGSAKRNTGQKVSGRLGTGQMPSHLSPQQVPPEEPAFSSDGPIELR